MINNKNFTKLQKIYEGQKQLKISDLFRGTQNRYEQFNISLQDLQYDFSKNNITEEIIELLILLAKELQLLSKIDSMFNGDKINITENRAVLHTVLRSESSLIINNKDIQTEISTVQNKIKQFCHDIHNGTIIGYTGKKINTIVNIGIGGSDLGIIFTSEALYKYKTHNIHLHFISSVDVDMADQVLDQIDYETTIFIIASKTFTTQETMLNANYVKNKFIQNLIAKDTSSEGTKTALNTHFIAVSNNLQACLEFGISAESIFLFWDFVGGRYSIWSAVGLALALYIGYDNYKAMLSGAKTMDEHFRNTELHHNMPVIMALIGIWHINICGYKSLLISPYNYFLRNLPSYLQQLEMESNGKSVDLNGDFINYDTCPIIWGESANNAQHAYYQLLHQGTQTIPIDVIIAKPDTPEKKVLFANAIAQSQAFMMGEENEYTHKLFKGNKPTSLLTLEEISPYNIGMLLALYEHKTFVQGVLWNVNSFDQMGVELGKKLTNKILDGSYKNSFVDSSTQHLIDQYL
jgi:glucose-6-phosphate isomerase